jgi:hypothetical protein
MWPNDWEAKVEPMSSIEFILETTPEDPTNNFKQMIAYFVKKFIQQDDDNDRTNIVRNNDRITRTIQVLTKITSTYKSKASAFQIKRAFLQEFFAVLAEKNISSNFKAFYPTNSEFSNNLLSTIESLHARLSALEAKCSPL